MRTDKRGGPGQGEGINAGRLRDLGDAKDRARGGGGPRKKARGPPPRPLITMLYHCSAPWVVNFFKIFFVRIGGRVGRGRPGAAGGGRGRRRDKSGDCGGLYLRSLGDF